MRSILIKKTRHFKSFIQPTLSKDPPSEAVRTVEDQDQYYTVDGKWDLHLNILLRVASSVCPDALQIRSALQQQHPLPLLAGASMRQC